MKLNFLNRLIYILFIATLILLSIDFILRMLAIKKNCCEYINLNDEKGKAYKCYDKITTSKTKSEHLKECELKNGKIIQVKDYKIIERKEINDWRY